MSAFTDIQGQLFAQMDAKAREVIEKRFGVRLDSMQSTEKQQAAWDVYQNATVKVIKAIGSAVRIDDPNGYAATIARNSCRDYWRIHNPGWADLKGRLSRFFRKQPSYGLWETDAQLGWICGPAGWRDKTLAEGNRVSALIDQPRRVRSSALPKNEVMEHVDAAGWDRLLQGIFEYLGGPVRLDELVSIAGVLFGVRGSREMAFDELSTGEDGRAWDPAAPERPPDIALAIRQQLIKLWNELGSMPKRWVIPFLLNPPVMKGAGGRKPRGEALDEGPDRGEVAVFTSNGIATVAQVQELIGFTDEHYGILWVDLRVVERGGPPLNTITDTRVKFAVIWNLLPLDDVVIARVLGLESTQKVINLRMVAKNHLAKVLVEPGIPQKRRPG
jgi:Sigma-70 region 2